MRLNRFLHAIREKIEEIPDGYSKHPEPLQISVDPGVEEFMSVLKRSRYGELRGSIVRSDKLIVWDASLADHNYMNANLRRQGFDTKGTPQLEFTLTPGYASKDIARSNMVEIGTSKVYATNNRAFRGSWFAQRLARYQPVQESMNQIKVFRHEYPYLKNPGLQEMLGFLRGHCMGQARIVITPSDLFIFSAYDCTHETFRLALEEFEGYDMNRYVDGVLSLSYRFTADPSMWTLPYRIGPIWYEFDHGQGSIASPLWDSLKRGLERMPMPEAPARAQPELAPKAGWSPEDDALLRDLTEDQLLVRNRAIDVLVNPSYQRLLGLVRKSGTVRAMESPEGVLAWPAAHCTHTSVQWAVKDQWGWFQEDADSGTTYMIYARDQAYDGDPLWTRQPRREIGELVLMIATFKNGKVIRFRKTPWMEQLQRAAGELREGLTEAHSVDLYFHGTSSALEE